MDWKKALKILLDGNERFSSGKIEHPNQTFERRRAVLSGQKPFAVILTCSDSRTPPEIIFDRGIGDLFVIRTAGNIADDAAVGSMEIAVTEFGVPLILVLGHQHCGAVKFAMKGGKFPGKVPSIPELIKPAIALAENQSGDPQDNVARANVNLVIEKLRKSEPVLSRGIREGTMKILGGYYWLDNGRVEIFQQ